MKKIIALFLVLALLSQFASAHPGKTDSRGGHHVGGTKEYHYHHGYPAHQHTDGICPYDFDDKTGQNSGSNSSGSEATINTNEPKENPHPAEVETEDGPWYVQAFWLALLILILWAQIKAIKIHKMAIDARHKYSGKSISRLACIPHGYSMDFNENVYFNGEKVSVDDVLVVYLSKSGHSYHKENCSHLHGTKTATSLERAKLFGYKQCKVCVATPEPPPWLREYKKINAARKRYRIEMNP